MGISVYFRPACAARRRGDTRRQCVRVACDAFPPGYFDCFLCFAVCDSASAAACGHRLYFVAGPLRTFAGLVSSRKPGSNLSERVSDAALPNVKKRVHHWSWWFGMVAAIIVYTVLSVTQYRVFGRANFWANGLADTLFNAGWQVALIAWFLSTCGGLPCSRAWSQFTRLTRRECSVVSRLHWSRSPACVIGVLS